MIGICKKLTLIVTTFLFCFLINYRIVNASEVSANMKTPLVTIQAAEENACSSLLGDPDQKEYPAYWLQYAFNIIKYLAIAALLIFSTMDFFKAMVENDKEALKKAGQKTAKRFIYCVIIFFLPNIIELIMEWFGAYGTCLK